MAAKDRPELIEQFRLPGRGATHQAFLSAMKGMLAKAASLRDLLVSRGMSESLLEDLGRRSPSSRAPSKLSSSGRRAHVGATADLEAVASEILEQVRMLDGLVRYRFGDNPELMAAWNSAHNVLGPFRSKVTPPPAGEGATPPGPDRIVPAA